MSYQAIHIQRSNMSLRFMTFIHHTLWRLEWTPSLWSPSIPPPFLGALLWESGRASSSGADDRIDKEVWIKWKQYIKSNLIDGKIRCIVAWVGKSCDCEWLFKATPVGCCTSAFHSFELITNVSYPTLQLHWRLQLVVWIWFTGYYGYH